LMTRFLLKLESVIKVHMRVFAFFSSCGSPNPRLRYRRFDGL
jgi:hypothetical protein